MLSDVAIRHRRRERVSEKESLSERYSTVDREACGVWSVESSSPAEPSQFPSSVKVNCAHVNEIG